MRLKPGMMVWIKCEVKPGPFSNERSVRVESDQGEWIGFVDVRYLKDHIEKGPTWILCEVVDIRKDSVMANLPGHALVGSRLFQGAMHLVNLAPVPA